jgi:hypothetical protein
MGLLEGMGATEKADIEERFSNLEAEGMQELTDRGLTGSTLTSNLKQGVARSKTRELGALEERVRGQKFSAEVGLKGDLLSYQERRQYPMLDYGFLAGGGGGGGGRGGVNGTGIKPTGRGGQGIGPAPQAMSNTTGYRNVGGNSDGGSPTGGGPGRVVPGKAVGDFRKDPWTQQQNAQRAAQPRERVPTPGGWLNPYAPR